MKKLLLLIVAVSLLMPVRAQETSSEKNVLKVNTLAIFLGTGSIFYERAFSESMSGQLGVGYLNYGKGGDRFSGLFLTPEVRFYPKKNAIDGMYLAPYLRYNKLTAKAEDAGKGSVSSMGGGLAFGRQWVTNSGFTMDLFFGGHYMKASVKAEDETGTSTVDAGLFDGFGFRIGFALGFAF
ncbi:MAG TPA: DUF3575 domain-containing protein [Bacteroidales bacterium]|nr:DUF3575 domain-containing protein [Bacteroidales bacterium]